MPAKNPDSNGDGGDNPRRIFSGGLGPQQVAMIQTAIDNDGSKNDNGFTTNSKDDNEEWEF